MNKSMNEVTAWLKALVHDGAHLRLDSRSVKPGDVFVAVPGLKADGRAFIRVAGARGGRHPPLATGPSPSPPRSPSGGGSAIASGGAVGPGSRTAPR